MSDKYTIETYGDAAGTTEVVGAWPDVVRAVSREMYSTPSADDELEVLEMLRDGIDDQGGWDGNRVHLQFEDGGIVVRKEKA